jgi:glycerol uptake facilitator protein
MVGDLPRRLVAEIIGTALLVLFGAGSVVAALLFGRGQLDYAGLGFISLSFAVVVAIVIYAFGDTSGAHINPAVTIGLAAGRRFPWREVPFYVAAQLVGAFAGGLLIVAAFGRRATELGGVGLTALGEGVNYGQGIVIEALGTFLLLLTIMALAVDRRAPTGWAGLMIGLAVAGEIFVIGPLTGGSINPARTFGPYLTNSLFGGETPWAQYGVYVAGPIIGAVLAGVVYDLVGRPISEMPEMAAQGAAGEIFGARERQDEEAAAARQDLAGEVPGARQPMDEETRRRVEHGGQPRPRGPGDQGR